MKEHKRIQPGKVYSWVHDGNTFVGKAGTPVLIDGVWCVELDNAGINVSVIVPVSQVVS